MVSGFGYLVFSLAALSQSFAHLWVVFDCLGGSQGKRLRGNGRAVSYSWTSPYLTQSQKANNQSLTP